MNEWFAQKTGTLEEVCSGTNDRTFVSKQVVKINFLHQQVLFSLSRLILGIHVAEWIGHWTQDHKIYSLIATAGHV